MGGSTGYPRGYPSWAQVTAPLKGRMLRRSPDSPCLPGCCSRDDGRCTLGSVSGGRHRENQHYHSARRSPVHACAAGLPRMLSSAPLLPQPLPRPRPQAWSPPPQARSAPEPRTSISGFPPPPPPLPPLRSPSPVRSGVIPDQDGGRGASRLVRFISTRASLDLRQRTPSQRASVGQRRPRGG